MISNLIDLETVSVCDGIGAFHVAVANAGLPWKCLATAEIEPFPAAVVAHRWGYPNLGDFTKIGKNDVNATGPVCLVGGTPCQDVSAAGLRAGFAGERSGLAIDFIKLAVRLGAQWILWENVPGVLSSWSSATPDALDHEQRGDPCQTNDFHEFLRGLGECGYGYAWRVLDAQHFGVAQRRRRVFVVAHLGDCRPPAAVLFDRKSMVLDPPPRHGLRVAPCSFVPALFARGYGESPRFDGPVGTLQKSGSETNPAVCLPDGRTRYLTPREWERLQGFPDDYTLIPWKGNLKAQTQAENHAYLKASGYSEEAAAALSDCPDGPRTGALGNSMAVPVMAWIVGRMELVRGLMAETRGEADNSF